MNKARGIIHQELWVWQEDGTAKLREDNNDNQELFIFSLL